ncbi:MAG: hypothetical protein ACM3ML_35000 [Micromonosporaceae bacterium]
MRSAPGAAAEPPAGRLLLQVAAKEPLDVVGLADTAGSGLVFTGGGAIEAVHAARRQGFSGPVLTDRRRYAGATRVRGTAPFAPSWLAGQREAGISPVLTDSGYIGDGDEEALRCVLRQAADAGPDVTAVLPLHAHWLRKDSPILITQIAAHEVPVALVLEHRSDPLAAPRAVAGLIGLLRRVPRVALLATGVGALAALAFGAAWAAVGVRRSLRHLLPATSEEEPAARRARWRPTAPEIVATPVLEFATVTAVVQAYLAAGKPSAWACRCASCHGRTPDWLENASAYDANAHNFDVLYGHADRLLRCDPGPPRQQAWRAECRAALDRYGELGLAELGWGPPRFLAAWAGETVPRRGLADVASRGAAAGREPGLRSAG